MADRQEVDSERREPTKKGLHGWKAAAAMFGCGTLAAFGVFGVLVSVLGFFFSVISSGVSSEGSPSESQTVVPEQTIKPRGSLATNAIDLCGRTIPQAEGSAVQRADSGGKYDDPGEGAAPRVITDQCEWVLIPSVDKNARWTLDFSYKAFAADSSGGSAGREASEYFEQRASRINEMPLEQKSAGDASVSDVSLFAHGLTGAGTTVYVTVVRSGDTVYEMEFESSREFPDEELVPVRGFEVERDALVEFIEVRLGIAGP